MKRVRESNKLALLCGLLSLLLIVFGFGCVQNKAVNHSQTAKAKVAPVKKATTQKKVAKTTTSKTQKEAKKVTKKPAKPKTVNLYAVNPKPLAFTECLRCHKVEFEQLKLHGAKHQQVACTACHTKFHAYNPLKHNYKQIMPKCSQCHHNPHGTNPAVQKCSECHRNPHEPLVSLPKPAKMANECKICHANIAAEMKKHPSAHAQLQCSDCHSRYHGRIPNCSECHQNHSPLVKMGTKQCLACHPVHTPLMIHYGCNKADNAICAGCHSKEFHQLQTHKTKHSALACAQCHPRHAMYLHCRHCHGEPHGIINKKFPNCQTCHGSPHNLNYAGN